MRFVSRYSSRFFWMKSSVSFAFWNFSRYSGVVAARIALSFSRVLRITSLYILSTP